MKSECITERKMENWQFGSRFFFPNKTPWVWESMPFFNWIFLSLKFDHIFTQSMLVSLVFLWFIRFPPFLWFIHCSLFTLILYCWCWFPSNLLEYFQQSFQIFMLRSTLNLVILEQRTSNILSIATIFLFNLPHQISGSAFPKIYFLY